jgi:hypothetical protein
VPQREHDEAEREVRGEPREIDARERRDAGQRLEQDQRGREPHHDAAEHGPLQARYSASRMRSTSAWIAVTERPKSRRSVATNSRADSTGADDEEHGERPAGDEVARLGDVRGEHRRREQQRRDPERDFERAPEDVGRQREARPRELRVAQQPLFDGETALQESAVRGPGFLQLIDLHALPPSAHGACAARARRAACP